MTLAEIIADGRAVTPAVADESTRVHLIRTADGTRGARFGMPACRRGRRKTPRVGYEPDASGVDEWVDHWRDPTATEIDTMGVCGECERRTRARGQR